MSRTPRTGQPFSLFFHPTNSPFLCVHALSLSDCLRSLSLSLSPICRPSTISKIQSLQDESTKREQLILQLTQELATSQHNFQTNEYNKIKLQNKLDELSKKDKYSQERLEDVMRECDKKINDLENNFENELRELRVKLRDYDNVVKEKMRLHTHVVVLEEEEKKIRGQNKEMMLQLSETRKRINNLEEQILKQEEEYEKSLENLEKKMRQREGVGGLERGNSSRGEGSFDEFGGGEDEEEDEREEKTEEEKEEKEEEKQKRKTSMKSPTAAAGAAATLENEIRLLKEQNDLLLREKETFLKEMASLNETSSPHPQLFPSSVIPHSPPQVITTTTDSTAILTEFVIPDNVIKEIEQLKQLLSELGLVNETKTKEISNLKKKSENLQEQYEQLMNKYTQQQQQGVSGENFEPVLQVQPKKLHSKGRTTSGNFTSKQQDVKLQSLVDEEVDGVRRVPLAPGPAAAGGSGGGGAPKTVETAIQTLDIVHHSPLVRKEMIDHSMMTDLVFIQTISEREQEILKQQNLLTMNGTSPLPSQPSPPPPVTVTTSSTDSQRVGGIEIMEVKPTKNRFAMTSSSFNFNDFNSYDAGDGDVRSAVTSPNQLKDIEIPLSFTSSSSALAASHDPQPSSSTSLPVVVVTSSSPPSLPVLTPLTLQEVINLVETVTNEYFDHLWSSSSSSSSQSLTRTLKEDNTHTQFQNHILHFFLNPNSGLIHQHIIQHEQKKGKKEKIQDITLCVLKMMERGIVQYLEVSHFEETKAELESKVDLVIGLETEINKLQHELEQAHLLTSTANTALAALSIDLTSTPADANTTTTRPPTRPDGDGMSADGSRLGTPQIYTKNMSFSGIDLLNHLPPSGRPTSSGGVKMSPLDDDSARSVTDGLNDALDGDISRHLSILNSHLQNSTEKRRLEHTSATEANLQLLQQELSDTQEAYHQLLDSYNIVVEEKNKFESILNELSHTSHREGGEGEGGISDDDKSVRSGFDFSKYLALAASSDATEGVGGKKSRAQALLELTKPPSIDRSQAVSSSRSSTGRKGSITKPVSKALPVIVGDGDDDISVLGDDDEVTLPSLSL
jgi:hypothetical protein